jgi:hypothetical protein
MFSLLNCILVSSVKFLYGDLHSGGYKICIASYMSEQSDLGSNCNQLVKFVLLTIFLNNLVLEVTVTSRQLYFGHEMQSFSI